MDLYLSHLASALFLEVTPVILLFDSASLTTPMILLFDSLSVTLESH